MKKLYYLPREFKPRDQTKLIKVYETGEFDYNQLAKLFFISKKTVEKILTPYRKNKIKELRQNVIERYKNKELLKNIASDMNISMPYASNIVRRANVEKRNGANTKTQTSDKSSIRSNQIPISCNQE